MVYAERAHMCSVVMHFEGEISLRKAMDVVASGFQEVLGVLVKSREVSHQEYFDSKHHPATVNDRRLRIYVVSSDAGNKELARSGFYRDVRCRKHSFQFPHTLSAHTVTELMNDLEGRHI
jgi:hypothetical protein